MHDGMPYGRNQGQGQGHSREVDRQSPTGLIFLSVFGHFLCHVSLRLYVFCFLFVLIKLSVLAKWSASKTPLRKPIRGKEIIYTKPRLKNVYDFFDLVYCFIVSLCVYRVLGSTQYISYPMAQYSLFVLKLLLSANQPADRPLFQRSLSFILIFFYWQIL